MLLYNPLHGRSLSFMTELKYSENPPRSQVAIFCRLNSLATISEITIVNPDALAPKIPEVVPPCEKRIKHISVEQICI